MGVLLDLEDLPLSESIEFLRHRMLSAPVPLSLEPHPGADVFARTRVADLGEIHLLSTASQGADIVRTNRLARDSAKPSLMVSVVDSGSGLVESGSQATPLHAGDIGLYVTDQPYRLKFSAGAIRHTFQIPFDDLDLPRDLVARQLAMAVHPDSVTTSAVSGFLLNVGRSAPGASDAEQDLLHRPTLDLVRLLLTRPVIDTHFGREAAARSLVTRIRQHINSQLDDPHLSARSIATSFAISERYVYSILARHGIDLGEMVRTRKLDRATRLLEDPAVAFMKIGTVAYECGFSDHAHFSRAFRARYGMSPSAWRSGALSRANQPEQP